MNEIGSRRLGVHNVAKTIELSKVFSCELVRIGCLRVTGTTWKFQKMGTNTQSTGFEIQGKNTVLRGLPKLKIKTRSWPGSSCDSRWRILQVVHYSRKRSSK